MGEASFIILLFAALMLLALSLWHASASMWGNSALSRRIQSPQQASGAQSLPLADAARWQSRLLLFAALWLALLGFADLGLAPWALAAATLGVALLFFVCLLMLLATHARRKTWRSDAECTVPVWMVTALKPMARLILFLAPDALHTLAAATAGKATVKEDMLRGILQFSGEIVRDIMTPRLDVVDLNVNTPFSEVVRLVSEGGYSRIPVYSGSRDNIVGVLYIKDLLPHLGKSDKFHWSVLMRPPLAVPETKKIDNLLREFQTKKVHLAIVIDEYGGVSGIVTLEDIIEEIVGEINDEYDDDSVDYVSVGQNAYVFDARTSVQNFCKIFELDGTFFGDFDEDADTLAGLLLNLIGDVPHKHQTIGYRQFLFEVLNVDERHISKIKVTIQPQDSDGTE